MSAEDYSTAQHVIVSSDGNDTTGLDDFLNAAGIARAVIAGVSRYSAVSRTRVAGGARDCDGARDCGVPPLDFPVESISMLYRRVDHADERSIWFRRLFVDVVSSALEASTCQTRALAQAA